VTLSLLPPPDSRFCPDCNAESSLTERYCPKCGRRFRAVGARSAGAALIGPGSMVAAIILGEVGRRLDLPLTTLLWWLGGLAALVWCVVLVLVIRQRRRWANDGLSVTARLGRAAVVLLSGVAGAACLMRLGYATFVWYH
jgi:hypothetical protein